MENCWGLGSADNSGSEDNKVPAEVVVGWQCYGQMMEPRSDAAVQAAIMRLVAVMLLSVGIHSRDGGSGCGSSLHPLLLPQEIARPDLPKNSVDLPFFFLSVRQFLEANDSPCNLLLPLLLPELRPAAGRSHSHLLPLLLLLGLYGYFLLSEILRAAPHSFKASPGSSPCSFAAPRPSLGTLKLWQ
ncbi:hypothetical protein CRG98_007781 [Punica granatum]|uniref:Uncharacterized protein n=1 Tax=Punica granatum TaxID=22663 RepID=A0A2I0KTQ3_PUNGR|nr:hypothetical protein CRG98_007781 [Punica granatum]